MMIAMLLLAAIITERNDIYTLAPSNAVFAGTASTPGIESQWIPYGTYSGGVGSAEYLRVTSNLAGVVISAFDGSMERRWKWEFMPLAEDYLDIAALSNTTRIVDLLSRGTSHGTGTTLEADLAEIAPYYGSRALSDIIPETMPPIASSWSENLPFKPSDAAAWKVVFPSYSLLIPDGTIWPTNAQQTYSRRWLPIWANPNHLAGLQGNDAYGSASSLYDALLPMSASPTASVQTILSLDTSWSAADFKHWTNGSTRLDWKRLGIICQLERQMETTYDVRGEEDYLPLIESWARRGRSDTGTYDLEFDIPVEGPGTKVADISPSNIVWEGVNYSLSTNITTKGWCYPTARAVAPTLAGSIISFNITADLVILDESTLYGFLEGLVAASGAASAWTNITMACSGGDLTVSGNSIVFSTGPILLENADDPSQHISYYNHDLAIPVTGRKDAKCYFMRGFDKTAAAVYTRSAAVDVPAIRARLDDLPSAIAWSNNVVATLSLPSLDFMLSAVGTGVVAYAQSATATPAMDYDDLLIRYIAGSADIWRAWKYSAGGPYATRTAALEGRVSDLVALNVDVWSKFAEVAGTDCSVLALARSQISDHDMALVSEQFGDLPVTYVLYPATDYGTGGFGLSASFAVLNGRAVCLSVDIDGLDYFAGQGWSLGEVALVVGSTSGAVDLTRDFPPARVDAHQNQIIRPLWRFKNLRDPNL